MRTFETGAKRDSDNDKLDYDGFLSPYVLRRFAKYMHEHRVCADGSQRASDNWQKGIPRTVYMKSAWRHFMSVWHWHRLELATGVDASQPLEDSLCALLFNIMGYLHEVLNRE